MNYKPKFLLIALSFFFCSSQAQSVKSQNENIWLHFVGKNKLNEKLSITLEATMRYANGFSEKQQWFIRPSVDYQFAKSFAGSVGYSHYNTYSYGDPTMNRIDTPEDHVWIQGTYVHNTGNVKFTHRLRDENRFVGIAKYNAAADAFEIDRYEYRNRMRYMILATVPLWKKDNEVKVSGFVGDEAFINIGSNAGKTLFNQNRVLLGAGYHFNSNHQIQLTYIDQYIWNYGNTLQERNPTLRISYLTTLDWSKKKA
ncbi:DUF2490 domain-containing protein [Flavobacterium sp.]|uniref:DUF2490 domain-containing protein n=1 Tax=Flavobacterium sp. TaxID=239 RepID=UPI0028BD3995|nr:DUF2490 domain-containing protein [Flavobacterium sp.]